MRGAQRRRQMLEHAAKTEVTCQRALEDIQRLPPRHPDPISCIDLCLHQKSRPLRALVYTPTLLAAHPHLRKFQIETSRYLPISASLIPGTQAHILIFFVRLTFPVPRLTNALTSQPTSPEHLYLALITDFLRHLSTRDLVQMSDYV